MIPGLITCERCFQQTSDRTFQNRRTKCLSVRKGKAITLLQSNLEQTDEVSNYWLDRNMSVKQRKDTDLSVRKGKAITEANERGIASEVRSGNSGSYRKGQLKRNVTNQGFSDIELKYRGNAMVQGKGMSKNISWSKGNLKYENIVTSSVISWYP